MSGRHFGLHIVTAEHFDPRVVSMRRARLRIGYRQLRRHHGLSRDAARAIALYFAGSAETIVK